MKFLFLFFYSFFCFSSGALFMYFTLKTKGKREIAKLKLEQSRLQKQMEGMKNVV